MSKKGTPTMGGAIIIMGIVVPVLLVADLKNVYVLIMLLVTTWMAIIGFIDDYIKVFRKNKEGLSAKSKLIGQVVCGLLVAITMIQSDEINVRLETEVGAELGYEQVSPDYVAKDAKGDPIEVAHYKAYITNVPFLKENQLDYAKWLPLEREQAMKWVWIVFVPLVILIITAESNAAN